MKYCHSSPYKQLSLREQTRLSQNLGSVAHRVVQIRLVFMLRGVQLHFLDRTASLAMSKQ